MMHRLDGARFRIERAKTHLICLHDFERRHWQAHESDFKIEFNPPYDLPRITLTEGARLVPGLFSVILGEAIYNLRAALDFLVFELARHDSGKDQDNTQFPIVDNMEKFSKETKRRLVGVSASHVHRIELLQPFNGCEWTRTLRDISNPDKHRKLTVIAGEMYGVAAFHFDMPENWHPPEPPAGLEVPYYTSGKVLKAIDPKGRTVSAYHDLKPFIAFQNRMGVGNVLVLLQLMVANSVQSFEADFDE